MTHDETTWRNAAIRIGENLATCGPAGYYDFTPQQWLEWALAVTEKMQADYMNLGACGERESCAKTCYDLMCGENPYDRWDGMKRCMTAIQARGHA